MVKLFLTQPRPFLYRRLSTKDTAALALKNGYAVVVDSIEAAMEMSDRLAVEHVELHVKDAMAVARGLKHYGGLFVGAGAAEVYTYTVSISI